MPAEGSLKQSSPLKREKGASGRYSPAVLRLSQENNIDLSLVEGSGREGRITRKDLLSIIESGNIPKAPAATVAVDLQPQQLQLHQFRKKLSL